MKKKWKAVVTVLAFAMVLNVPIPVLAGGTLNTDKLRTESVSEDETEITVQTEASEQSWQDILGEAANNVTDATQWKIESYNEDGNLLLNEDEHVMLVQTDAAPEENTVIAFYNFSGVLKFRVVLKVSHMDDNRYEITVRTLTKEESEKLFSGVELSFEGDADFSKVVDIELTTDGYEPVSEGLQEEDEKTTDEEDVKMPGLNRDDYQAVEKEEEAESGIDIFSILIVLLFAGIVGTSVMITKMFIDSNKARAKENEEYFVKKNEEFKASKARENEALDEYINSCEEDYSDDPDYEENSQDTPGTEEDGGENDESESGMDKTFEDIESDESEYEEMVAGEHALEKTQSQPAGHSFRMEQPSKNRNASANTPAWMRTMSDENEGDDDCFY